MSFADWLKDHPGAAVRIDIVDLRLAFEAGRAAGIEEAAATVEKPGYVKINGISYALTYVIGAVENYVRPAGGAARIAELEAAVARKDAALEQALDDMGDSLCVCEACKEMIRAALEKPK